MKREIQQNGKAGNSAKLENWKSDKSGFITKTAKRESYEAALSGIQMSRRAEIQETTSYSLNCFLYLVHSYSLKKSGLLICNRQCILV